MKDDLHTAPPPQPWSDPHLTAEGAPRAQVGFRGFETLWFNTGTVCNLACATCYIESTPQNDRLAFLTPADIAPYLESLGELEDSARPAATIGFTGGEPFANPHMPALAEAALGHGRSILILTNAMGPMMRAKTQAALLALRAQYGPALRLRVSLDHHTAARHDAERGPGAFEAALAGLTWLAREGFAVSVAGRAGFAEEEHDAAAGFQALFDRLGVALNAQARTDLVLFPEMDLSQPAPEITAACWSKVGADPDAMMCATSRMVVKDKGAEAPRVAACTLLPYAPNADMGADLALATRPVTLAHPFCAQFCVLGGASCSAA